MSPAPGKADALLSGDGTEEEPRVPDRRRFLKRSAVVAGGLALGACELRRPAAEAGAGDGAEAAGAPKEVEGRGAAAARALESELLPALGAATLPTEVGDEGRAAAVRGFRAWIAGFRPVAERMHGYGSAEIRYGEEDPAPRWGAQLLALDRLARAREGRGFVELDPAPRRGLVRERLEREGIGGEERAMSLPSDPARASHVAVGFLAWWAGTPQATDLCYGAAIGGNSCRPLAASGRRPERLREPPSAYGPPGS